jgi:hypothetical protein
MMSGSVALSGGVLLCTLIIMALALRRHNLPASRLSDDIDNIRGQIIKQKLSALPNLDANGTIPPMDASTENIESILIAAIPVSEMIISSETTEAETPVPVIKVPILNKKIETMRKDIFTKPKQSEDLHRSTTNSSPSDRELPFWLKIRDRLAIGPFHNDESFSKHSSKKSTRESHTAIKEDEDVFKELRELKNRMIVYEELAGKKKKSDVSASDSEKSKKANKPPQQSSDSKDTASHDTNESKLAYIHPSHFKEEKIPVAIDRVAELVQLYNNDPSSIRKEYLFREFTVVNIQAIGKDHGIEPEYCIVDQNQQGDYWLIEIDKHLYALPKNKNIYNIGQFKSNGLIRIFQCGGLRPGYRYRKIEIIKPAEFRDLGAGSLRLIQQGILKLSHEEEEL